MMLGEQLILWILGAILILSSLGVILLHKPVHASLSFLLTLLMLATLYLQLSASFIAVMQILVYAGAILVLFMFVIILFQDAHEQLDQFKPQSNAILLWTTSSLFLFILAAIGSQFLPLNPIKSDLPETYGSVQNLGRDLYIDFFFPFEAIVLLFLIAVVGSLYIAKKRSS